MRRSCCSSSTSGADARGIRILFHTNPFRPIYLPLIPDSTEMREKEMGGRQRKYNYLGAGLRGVGPIGIYQIGSLDYLVERPQTRTDGLSQIEFTKSVDIDHRLP